MWIIVMIATCLVLYIVVRCYLRIKMRFWSLQPVFHIYNLLYWLNPPGIIRKELSPLPLTKFVNTINVKVCTMSELSDVNQTRACQLIHDHYIGTADARVSYTPTVNHIMPYLLHNNGTTFMGIYFQPTVLLEKAAATVFNQVLGVITARPLDVQRFKKTKLQDNFRVYYVDHLCVHTQHRRKDIAPQLIQTLPYQISRQGQEQEKHLNKHKHNPPTVYLFKREGELNAIVPLLTYTTYCVDIEGVKTPRLSSKYTCCAMQITTAVITFLKTQRARFEWSIVADVSALIALVKTGNLFLYALVREGVVMALYGFKNTPIYYGADRHRAIECTCVLSTCKNESTLLAGFTMALVDITRQQQFGIRYVLVEDVADASRLIVALKRTQSVLFTSPTAFFFYNYACYSAQSKNILLLF